MILKSQIEHDAEVLLEYARSNRISSNKDKTKVIRCRPYSSMYDTVFGISFGDAEVIEIVAYLGMIP